MKIEVKKVSINNRLSEETLCFSADVYIDGKRAGFATNRGHGGATDYHLTDRALEARAKEWAREYYKAHGTEEERDLLTPHGGYTPDPLEFLIDHLVHEAQRVKEEQKIAKVEAKQASDFARRGLPFMLRVETYGSIIWYGLKSNTPKTVSDATAAAEAKHGEITRVTVLATCPLRPL